MPRQLTMALDFFARSPLWRWPGLAYYFMGWSLFRACGVRLFDERTLHFKNFRVGADAEGKSGLVFLHEILVRDIYGARALAADPDARVIFDAGANCGFFALTCCANHPSLQAWCFEPHPATFRHLQRNVALNQLENRMHAVQAAVGAAPGRCDLNVSEESSMGIVATSSTQFLEKPAAVSVEMVSFDDFAARQQVRPDVLKIDVEGFEVEVLRGATECLRHARRVMLEYHSDTLRDQCREILERAGFDVALRPDEDLILAQRKAGA